MEISHVDFFRIEKIDWKIFTKKRIETGYFPILQGAFPYLAVRSSIYR